MKFDVVTIDPAWPYFGDPNKDQAAGKHYSLETDQEIFDLPVRDLLNKNACVFVWATSPKLHLAIKAIERWGLHYRGVAYVWVKTNKAGGIINGQGVRPTYTKPTTEYLLLATTKPTGRMLQISNEGQAQVILHGRGAHSQKPEIFQEMIRGQFGDGYNYLEMFARRELPGWTCIGNAITGKDILEDMADLRNKA